MITRGLSIFRTASVKHRFRSGDGNFRNFALPNIIKRNASNSWSAIKDTYLSTKEVFENHRVVFTVGTSIASVLTAWAGYSIRRIHHNSLEKRLGSIEDAMKKNYDVEHEEIRKIVTSGNVSITACLATAGTSMVLGYGLGWRGGAWFANRKFRREQLKLLGHIKPNRWQILRRPFVRLRKLRSTKKTAELQPPRVDPPMLCSKLSSNSS